MQITIVENRARPDGPVIVYAYEPSGQFFGNGGTVDDWKKWIAEAHPEWPAPVVASSPPPVHATPPEHGEKCSLCGQRKRDVYEYRLNAIALGAFGHRARSTPAACRLCNPDGAMDEEQP